ncbi:Exonuclease/helicase-like [Parasponia andersonii]|uniref:Exonuclease/helicase-like n=1 Tax=Parasponia andersonii TaxID=3476 RepID=A0A2P5DLB6_PARAD|nr:Exonuclease/helicase-like [Parasponia andersonii]
MGSSELDGNGTEEALPPPPPVIPPDVVPIRAESEQALEPVKKKTVRVPMARLGLGSKGQKIPLLTNHFKVKVSNVRDQFFHYSVALFYEDGRPVDGKGVGRKVLDRVHETYNGDLGGKNFAYDGEKSLFTVGPLPGNKLEFVVVLEDVSKDRVNGNQSPNGLGSPSESDRKRLRRQYQSKTFKVEISFAAKIPMQAIASALRGQESENSQEALRVLDIILRQHASKQFSLKQKGGRDGDNEPVEVTVYDYFVNQRHINLRYSADLPCINVGKPKRPTFFPLELCTLVSLQRYTKALSTFQRSSLVEKSRQKPHERMSVLSNALKRSNYDAEPMLRECGIAINNNFTQVDGRVLPAPKLKAGNGEDFFPRNGKWNFNNKKLAQPTKIEKWAVVNFNARCDVQSLVQNLIKCGEMKGILMKAPFDVFQEGGQLRRAPPMVRVEKMFDEIQSRLPGAPDFLLCLLPERKNCDLYGPWKKKNLSEFGIVTQCIAPTRVNDQYLTNVLLKINAKLGGLNSFLAVERSTMIPVVSKSPTLILGMDVSHGSPGQSDIPSIAAVVSSREWPLISRYRASVRTQSPKVEMIDSLYKRVENEDEGIMRELLLDFYTSSGKRKPDQIIIFRDGVSESQFNQVLNIELDQIIEACKFLDENWNPKFVVIIAQKNHHTKFFQQSSPENVPPGTIIDNRICHPKNNDFYLCAHAGMIGTTRPTHYHVLLDEVGFSADDLQELVHSLSYVYQRSTTAISVVAPICYAHLAASQVGQFMKFDDSSETSSSHGGLTSVGAPPVPQLPKLKESVCNSMFFC